MRTKKKTKLTGPERPVIAIRRIPKCAGNLFAAARDGDGVMVGGELKGRGVLLRIDEAGATKVVAPAGVGPIYDLHIDGNVRWLCDGAASVVRWDSKAATRIDVPIERALGVTRDAQGQLWVAGLDEQGTWLGVAVSTDGRGFKKLRLPSECHCDVWPLVSTRHGVLLPVVTEDTRDLLWLGRGASVKAMPLRGDFTAHGGAETPAGTLLMCDGTGQLHRSEDGGKTWRRKQVTPDLTELCSVAVFGGDRVVVAGFEGFVAVSDDDGRSFVELEHSVRATKHRFRRGDPGLMCAAPLGHNGFVVAGPKGIVLIGRPRAERPASLG